VGVVFRRIGGRIIPLITSSAKVESHLIKLSKKAIEVESGLSKLVKNKDPLVSRAINYGKSKKFSTSLKRTMDMLSNLKYPKTSHRGAPGWTPGFVFDKTLSEAKQIRKYSNLLRKLKK